MEITQNLITSKIELYYRGYAELKTMISNTAEQDDANAKKFLNLFELTYSEANKKYG